ncbi:MAG: DUF4229 domain-containing protein [Micromonosporaceae bacterium]|nr:DUF4229 domain-containing protein [Micromonosporaceae bacterium]
MSAAVKYTLGRIGLFALVAVALLPFRLDLFLTLMIALLVSMALSYFLLRTWREEFAAQIAEAARKRKEQKEKLRAALAGEDETPEPAKPAGEPAKDDPKP